MSYIQIVGGTGTAAGGIAVSLSGNNTSGALALVSTGTLRLAGGNNVTLSQNGQSITISAANSAPATLSYWEPAPMGSTNSVAMGLGTLSIAPISPQAYISASRAHLLLRNSVSTSSNSSYQINLTASAGIYTLTGGSAGTLNLITDSSGTRSFSISITSSSSSNLVSDVRVLSVPMAFNASPGNYWMGVVYSSASTNANWITFNPCYVGAGAVSGIGYIGDAFNASSGMVVGGGFLSVTTGALPATIALSNLQASVLRTNVLTQYVNFQGGS